MPELKEERIWLSPPHLTGNELSALDAALASGWIAPTGPQVEAFEDELSSITGAPFVLAVNSGTAAIHLAARAFRFDPGEEIICPSLTYIASANPFLYEGVRPVFIDSQPYHYNISPRWLEACLIDREMKGRKPAALLLAHLYGAPANMEEIMQICEHYDLPVIEDAAESLGATYDGQMVGTFGVFGAYSFNGNKIVTTSGGGALASFDGRLIDEAWYFATQARENAPHYEHTESGFNYRLSNLLAAVGLAQLQDLPARIRRRREIRAFYRKRLGEIGDVLFYEPPPRAFATHWLTTFQVKPGSKVARDAIIAALDEENIEARPVWKPLHLQPLFKNADYFGGNDCVGHFEGGVCLPSGAQLTDEQLDRICSIIEKLWDK